MLIIYILFNIFPSLYAKVIEFWSYPKKNSLLSFTAIIPHNTIVFYNVFYLLLKTLVFYYIAPFVEVVAAACRSCYPYLKSYSHLCYYCSINLLRVAFYGSSTTQYRRLRYTRLWQSSSTPKDYFSNILVLAPFTNLAQDFQKLYYKTIHLYGNPR